MSEDKNVSFYGKVAKFPKNTKASKAYNFLEHIKIPKSKLWYFIIEKEIVFKEVEKTFEELQIIKYNNQAGINCAKFLENLKEYYKNNPELSKYINHLKIDGSENLSTIRNIPNVEIGGKTLISIITEDLIKLLYK